MSALAKDSDGSRAVIKIIGYSALVLLVAAFGLLYTFKTRADDSAAAARGLAAGLTLYQQGDFDQASRRLRSAVRLSPADAKARALLGHSYEALGRFDQAARAYRRSLRIEQDQPQLLYKLALVDKERGDLKAATRELRQALAKDKNFVAARLLLARIHQAARDFDGALKEYSYLIELNPFGLDRASLYADKGIVYLQKDDRANAEKAWAKALEIDPDNQKAKNLLTNYGSDR